MRRKTNVQQLLRQMTVGPKIVINETIRHWL